MVSKAMLNSLLQKQLTYQPETQPYFTFCDGSWQPRGADTSTSRSTMTGTKPLNHLCVITWNIDFMASQPRARMVSTLLYLENLVSTVPSSHGVIINLQEIMESKFNPLDRKANDKANDLSQIQNARWIQERFNITDIDTSHWYSPYGQLTLIDRRLAISSVSRLHFVSEFQRDALFVDVCLDTREPSLLRVCNVHLDSSYGALRPIQWKTLQQHLQDDDRRIVASVLAGDCNANQEHDRTAPQDNGFKDAYLELGGIEGSEIGATWGFQSLETRWGTQRLDKEVFWGEIHIDKLERIGVGVKVGDVEVRKDLEEKDELPFATDHYGLIGEFTLKDGLATAVNASTEH